MLNNIIKNTMLIIFALVFTTQNNFTTHQEVIEASMSIKNFPTVKKIEEIFAAEPDGFCKSSFDSYSNEQINDFKRILIMYLEIFYSEETNLDKAFLITNKMYSLFDILGTLYKEAEPFPHALWIYINLTKK